MFLTENIEKPKKKAKKAKKAILRDSLEAGAGKSEAVAKESLRIAFIVFFLLFSLVFYVFCQKHCFSLKNIAFSEAWPRKRNNISQGKPMFCMPRVVKIQFS